MEQAEVAVKPQDDRLLVDALIEWKKPEFARQELGWSKTKFNKVVKDYGIPLDIGQRHADMAWIAKILFEEINCLTKEAVPDKFIEKMERCYHHYDTDDLVGLLVNTFVDFAYEGFHAKGGDEKEDEKITAFNKKYDLDSVVLQMFHSAGIWDNILLGWEQNRDSIGYVLALDPRTHIVIPQNKAKGGVPQFDVWRKVDPHINRELEREVHKKSKIGRPKKVTWEPIGKNEYVLVRGNDGKRDRLITPAMVKIFPDIELRRLKRDGLFTAVYHFKFMIHQIQVGPSVGAKGTAPWASLKIPSQPQLDKIKAEYTNSDKTMLEVTNADHNHKFIAPDVEYMDGKIMDSDEMRIIRQASQLALHTSLQKYAGGFLQIKALKAKIRKWRKLVTRILQEFYRATLGIKHVTIMWDEFNLLEPAQVVERVKAARDYGLSGHTFMESLGFHPDYEVQTKVQENPEDYKPHWDINHGEDPGRPEDPDKTNDRSPGSGDE